MSQSQIDAEATYYFERTNQLSYTIIDAVADLEETDPLELPPLYDTIDPTALDSLFRSPRDGTITADGRLEFAYNGYEVRVYDDQIALTKI